MRELYSAEAEDRLLSLILRTARVSDVGAARAARLCSTLRDDAFAAPLYRDVFICMAYLAKIKQLSAPTLMNALSNYPAPQGGTLLTAFGAERIREWDAQPDAPQGELAGWAAEVNQWWIRRQLRSNSIELYRAAGDLERNAGSLITLANELVATIGVARTAISEPTSLDIRGVQCGIPPLDQVTPTGLPAGCVTMLGSNPGGGKTLLAMQAAMNVLNQGGRVLWGTFQDMNHAGLLQRWQDMGVPQEHIARWDLNVWDGSAHPRASEPSPFLDEILRMDAISSFDLVVVDVLQGLRSNNRQPRHTPNLVASAISDAARCTRTAWLVTVHLSKRDVRRTAERWQPTDAPRSDEVSAVTFRLLRPPEGEYGMLYCIKNRYGNPGATPVRFNKERLAFEFKGESDG